MTFLDTDTATEVKNQLDATSGSFADVNQLYDVKLTPKMNFTIKLASLYDSAESDSPLGNWIYTDQVDGGNTGKKQYQSADRNTSLIFSSEAKSKLNKNKAYYLSMYMKADSDTEPTIKVKGQNSTIASKKVKLNNKRYQRVDILVKNRGKNPIDRISVKGDSKTNVYWDDITITDISSIKPDKEIRETNKDHNMAIDICEGITDKEIQEMYKDYSETKNGHYINAVTFKNIKLLKKDIKNTELKLFRDTDLILKKSEAVIQLITTAM
ncbi:hypothetical protein P7H22_08770 [Paenibacillus larvae]|nr:hypothetical protein [Paenibacillus larvae]MDT2240402.1 hypothetical protein [Paenibacillus larvae]